MDWWHIILPTISAFATAISIIAIGLNWIYRRDQSLMQNEIKKIITRIEACPGTCLKHEETTQGIFKVLDMDDKLDRIYRMMLYLIKKNYFHRHSEDGKSLIMADGLEEFIKDVTADNK